VGKGADLSPIENLWDTLEHRVRGKTERPKNTTELAAALREAWGSIAAEECAHLVHSVPRRVAAVIKARGLLRVTKEKRVFNSIYLLC
jgi:hypothetical protein